MLFAGDDYYPNGGMSDFVGHFDSIYEILQELNQNPCGSPYGWAHIYDIKHDNSFNLYRADGFFYFFY